MARLFKIQFSTKKFPAKIFIKMHRFQLIDQQQNLKGGEKFLGRGIFLGGGIFLSGGGSGGGENHFDI